MILRRVALGLAALLLACCACQTSPAPVSTVPPAAVPSSPPGVPSTAASPALAPSPSASVLPSLVPVPSPSIAAVSGPLTTLNIAYPSISLSWFPLYVADQEGFLRDEGLAVQTTEMSPTTQIAAIASGEVDYTTALGSALGGAAQGLPITTISAMCARPQHILEAAPDIQSVQDLKGKAVAVSSLGSTTQREVITVLQKNGMSASDVTFVSMGDEPGQVAGLLAGRASASPLTVPENFVAEKSGMHDLVNIADVVDAPLAGISTSKAHLEAHPDEAVHLLRAVQRAVQFTQTNRDETVRLIAQFNSVDAQTASAAYDLVVNTWSPTGIVSDDALRNTFTDPQQAASVDVSSLVDWSYAREASGD